MSDAALDDAAGESHGAALVGVLEACPRAWRSTSRASTPVARAARAATAAAGA